MEILTSNQLRQQKKPKAWPLLGASYLLNITWTEFLRRGPTYRISFKWSFLSGSRLGPFQMVSMFLLQPICEYERELRKSPESLRLCLLSRYRPENLCLSFSYIMGVTYFAVQSLSHVWLFATPWTAAGQSSLSFTISQSFLKLMSIEFVMPSRYLILCHPLLLSSVFPRIRVFSSELALCIRWPKYWSFSVSISPPNEYSRLTFFRIDLLSYLE